VASLAKRGIERMDRVRDVLETKGHDVWTISPDASVFEALQLMANKGVGALVVLERDNVVGIISERDYARAVELRGKSSRETTVGEIMTRKVAYVRPENTIEECMAVMTHKRIRHLPVLQGDRLTGVISIGDVVKAIISEQQFVIQQLENYIAGG
jgi:CBS domain-containing protein